MLCLMSCGICRFCGATAAVVCYCFCGCYDDGMCNVRQKCYARSLVVCDRVGWDRAVAGQEAWPRSYQ